MNNSIYSRLSWIYLLSVGLFLINATSLLCANTPAERRQLVLDAFKKGSEGIPVLEQALEDDATLVRLAAVRSLGMLGDEGADVLRRALNSSDPDVRRATIAVLGRMGGMRTEEFRLALNDKDATVRHAAVSLLVQMKPVSEDISEMLRLASKDPSPLVRETANDAIWFRPVTSLRDGDLYVRVAQSIPLPEANWSFHLDPEREGYFKGWHDPSFDDASWEAIGIAAHWQEFGYNHVGVAWYRLEFDLPEEPAAYRAVEIHFDGVDESTWVWINGKFAGKHDIGPSGWNKPFQFDVTEFLNWKGKNHIAVRVMNTIDGGGIWKPVFINVLTH